MTPPPARRPYVFPQRPFSVREALDHGIDRKRLRAGDLTAPFPRVRITTLRPLDLADRCRAFEPRRPASITLAELVAAGDHIIHHERPLATRDQLRDAVARYPGRQGRANLKLALEFVHERAESPRESLLRMAKLAAARWVMGKKRASHSRARDAEGYEMRSATRGAGGV